ncbi:MAG: GH109 [uncultured Solirubrobacteraceae bacterium]|uniref:GH109 n=1 Tax=uncultured Solirubrobacteraceae bacterium TaxID=1162706 RepID=A0A6J4TDP2_9ACTN|nr:MAG: GH109 [uncultured Solirubrobacteraceae bacterium]
MPVVSPVNVAVVGLGYWGPNLVRNLWDTEGAHMGAVCDPNRRALGPIARRYPSIRAVESYEELLADEEIDAVAIATPVHTHFEMARAALHAGKHVFVEKPMAARSEDCRELIALADERSLVLMPGHTFLYSPPVRKIKELLEAGELGELFFATFSRVNLGIHQSDVSVVRDLGPHDFSMLLYWLGQPTFVRAIGRDAVGSGQLDVAFIDLGLANGALVHMELSWLAPTKLRRTVLVGSGKMVVYEDTSSEQVRVFDRGVEVMEPQSFGEYQLSYRSGDVTSPRLDAQEPLRLELEDFVTCVREGTEPLSSKKVGLDVVRIIEAAETSLQFHGSPVALDTPSGDRRRNDRRRNKGGMPNLETWPAVS